MKDTAMSPQSGFYASFAITRAFHTMGLIPARGILLEDRPAGPAACAAIALWVRATGEERVRRLHFGHHIAYSYIIMALELRLSLPSLLGLLDGWDGHRRSARALCHPDDVAAYTAQALAAEHAWEALTTGAASPR